MSGLADKIGLGVQTYWQGWCAVSRQYRAGDIERIQNVRLRRLIRYCFEHIKYYREEFERAGINPEEINSAKDMENLPILTKEELRSRWWDFLPRELPCCRVSRTSGSTGIPVCILSDRNSRVFNSAGVIRYRRALGMKFLGGQILTPLKTPNEWHRPPHRTFLQGVHKTYYINPYSDDAEYAKRLFSVLKRPAIVGITPAIRALAYRVRDGVFPALTASVVITSGESLAPKVRGLLESTFEAKVADVYACNEAGDVAWQCLCGGGYHINADNIIVEIIKEGKKAGDGEVGEVVITNLSRYVMPIIRYKNGDLARFSGTVCPCGCRLPMLEELAGRTGEDLMLPGGGMVPWNQLKGLMNHPWIRQFQIVQDARGSLHVRYVCENAADTSSLEHLILYRYKRLVGDSIPVTVDRCDQIRPEPSGKSRLVISDYK